MLEEENDSSLGNLFEYLADEVLDMQSEEQQDFLVRTIGPAIFWTATPATFYLTAKTALIPYASYTVQVSSSSN